MDPSSKWSITVEKASIDKTKSWDTLVNTEPDVYVEVEVGASNKGKTTVKNNTYTPYWNELVLTTTAGSLNSYKLKLTVWDDDWPYDQTMGKCTLSVPDSVLSQGYGYANNCGGSDVTYVKLLFTAN